MTSLLIPGLNDSDADLDAMTRVGGRAVRAGHADPLHRGPPGLQDAGPAARTRGDTGLARRIAADNALRHAYTGNVHDASAVLTWPSTNVTDARCQLTGQAPGRRGGSDSHAQIAQYGADRTQIRHASAAAQ